MSQTVSLPDFVPLFIEIFRTPWEEDQPVEMLLSIKNNSGIEHKVTSTLRDGFETAILASGFSRQETHCVVRPIDWYIGRRTFQPLSKTLSQYKH